MQPSSQSIDFAVLQQALPGQTTTRNRRALWWLLGLLLLVVVAVVALVMYLNAFEKQEEERQRMTDGQWLEQSVRFHFNRLEEDLLVRARRATMPIDPSPAPPLGGLLWNEPGAVLVHAWLPAPHIHRHAELPKLWQQQIKDHPDNAESLSSMQDIAAGLRRSAYAGPMHRANGELTDVVWLAMPFFERGDFQGIYVAALSMNACVRGLVPPWFRQNHAIRLTSDWPEDNLPGYAAVTPYLAPMNLPGADLFIEVSPPQSQPATVPRIFLLVALLFLAGMLFSLMALRRDMQKRQHVQALLQAQVALRSAMENSATIGLRAWDMGGKILYVNDAFCRMVGYPRSELLGQSAPLPYWPADRSDELDVVHRDVLAQGTQSDGVEVQFRHRDGGRVDVLIHEAPLMAANGEQMGWMSSIIDISERKRAQQLAAQQQDKLEASGRLVAMGEVASTLAHELNQPLGALSSFAHGLLNRLDQGSIALQDVKPVVDRMARLSDKAGGIIQRVNAFARRRELARQNMDLAPFLRRAVGAQAENPTVNVVQLPGPDPLWVQADELLLEHVIGNLLGNAIDWAPHGPAQIAGTDGPASVRAWLVFDEARQLAGICVADSGPGVRDEDRAHIFSAFFTTKDDGMGMGLAICRSIVEAHHGQLEVTRDAELGGARFCIWLPLNPTIMTEPAP
jgi:two-component system sensor histidine kinase DctS